MSLENQTKLESEKLQVYAQKPWLKCRSRIPSQFSIRSWAYIFTAANHASLASPAQRWAKWRLSALHLYPRGGGAWGAGTNMWHPETPASYASLPAPLATQIPTLWIHTSGRGPGRGALILDRCWAFDLFAGVDAHLCSCSEGGR